jgi:hypothetical protein
VFLGNHVPEIDADSKHDTPLFGHLRLAVDHPALDLRSAADGVHNARKFRQQAIAGVLYGAAPVLPNLRIDQLGEMRPEAFVRPLLIRSHQTRVAGHIGGEDRGKTAFDGLFHASPGPAIIAETTPPAWWNEQCPPAQLL